MATYQTLREIMLRVDGEEHSFVLTLHLVLILQIKGPLSH